VYGQKIRPSEQYIALMLPQSWLALPHSASAARRSRSGQRELVSHYSKYCRRPSALPYFPLRPPDSRPVRGGRGNGPLSPVLLPVV
jgi:hypothetical protein